MVWDQIKNSFSQGAKLVKEKSSEAIDYLKSDDFKEKVANGVQKTKEGVCLVTQKVKENKTVQKMASGTQQVFEDIKNSDLVKKIENKISDKNDQEPEMNQGSFNDLRQNKQNPEDPFMQPKDFNKSQQ